MNSKTSKSKLNQMDFIPIILKIFLNKGVEEVSLPELTECVAELGKLSLVSYHFPEGLFYSYELFDDLKILEYKGCIQRYEYTHDSFLPKTYYKLTMLGQGVGKRLLDILSEEMKRTVEDAVALSITNNNRRWRLVSRKHIGVAASSYDLQLRKR